MESLTEKKNTFIIKLAQQETYLQPECCLLILLGANNHSPRQIPSIISTATSEVLMALFTSIIQ